MLCTLSESVPYLYFICICVSMYACTLSESVPYLYFEAVGDMCIYFWYSNVHVCMYVCTYSCWVVALFSVWSGAEYIYSFLCVCICIYVCMYICIYVYMYVHLFSLCPIYNVNFWVMHMYILAFIYVCYRSLLQKSPIKEPLL